MYYKKVTKAFKKKWIREIAKNKTNFNEIFSKVYHIERFIENQKEILNKLKNSNFGTQNIQSMSVIVGNGRKANEHNKKRLSNINSFEKDLSRIIKKIKEISIDYFTKLELEGENNINNNSMSNNSDMSLKLSKIEYENLEENDNGLTLNIAFFFISFVVISLCIILFIYRLD